MANNNNRQRREADRRRQQRRTDRRSEQEARKQRLSVIAAAIGTLAVIAAVVIFFVATRNTTPATPAAGSGTASATPSVPASASPSASASAAACGTETFPAQKVRAASGAAVSFAGVRVVGAKDLGGKPGVTSKASAAPSKLRYRDLVVGKGQAAGPTSCVTVQYDGVLYKTGKEFDSSWSRGMLAQFPLTGVVPGFTQGIGGTTGVPPMKVGGRRVIVLPPALGYGAQGSPPAIPANAPLVFVIDLTKVTSG